MAAEGLQRVSRKGRPNHPLEFKQRLAQVACMSGISVAKMAQEHRINARSTSASAVVQPSARVWNRPFEACPASPGSRLLARASFCPLRATSAFRGPMAFDAAISNRYGNSSMSPAT
jgi:hypothetical protein